MTFPRVLKSLRKKRGLTQEALAKRVGKSSSYIAALEMEECDRAPSIGMLRDLILALAGEDAATGKTLDCEAVSLLVFAALNLDGTLTAESDDTDSFEAAFKAASTVWVVSDRPHEVMSKCIKPENLRDTDKKFVFLVPFSLPDKLLEIAMSQLDHCGVEKEELFRRVSIFRVSSCAVSARVWITDPFELRPQGFYSIGRDAVRRMPGGVLNDAIRTYSNLCSLFHASREDTKLVGCPEIGYIQLKYPLEHPSSSLEMIGYGGAQGRW
jgi:transcriptional regulator with XRE-family HTH domain